ncbi:hypothetical protein ES703_07885 [subsurface metagenome]
MDKKDLLIPILYLVVFILIIIYFEFFVLKR